MSWYAHISDFVHLLFSDDVNIPAVVAAVVVICLVVICGIGGFYAHRNGYFTSESLHVCVCVSL